MEGIKSSASPPSALPLVVPYNESARLQPVKVRSSQWKSNRMSSPSMVQPGAQAIPRSTTKERWIQAPDSVETTRERAPSHFAVANPLRASQSKSTLTAVGNKLQEAQPSLHRRRQFVPSIAPLGCTPTKNPLACAVVDLGQQQERSTMHGKKQLRQRRALALVRKLGTMASAPLLHNREGGSCEAGTESDVASMVSAANFDRRETAGLSHTMQANAVSQLVTPPQAEPSQSQDHFDARIFTLRELPAPFTHHLPNPESESDSSSDGSEAGGFVSQPIIRHQAKVFGGLTVEEFVKAAERPKPSAPILSIAKNTPPPPQVELSASSGLAGRIGRLKRMGLGLPSKPASQTPWQIARMTTSRAGRRSTKGLSAKHATNISLSLHSSSLRSEARRSLLQVSSGSEGQFHVSHPIDSNYLRTMAGQLMVQNPLSSGKTELTTRRGSAGWTTIMRPRVRSDNCVQNEDQEKQLEASIPFGRESKLAPAQSMQGYKLDDHELLSLREKRKARKAAKEARKRVLLGWMRYFFMYNEMESFFSWAVLVVVGTGLSSFLVLDIVTASSNMSNDNASLTTSESSAKLQAYAGLVLCVAAGLVGALVGAAEVCMALLFFIWRQYAVRRLGVTAGWLKSKDRINLSRMAALARELDGQRAMRAGNSAAAAPS
jgi:hypothetical protein